MTALRKVTSKMSGDSQLVVALVLIAVAIGLCIIFRNTIGDIMNSLFTTIGTQINALAAGSVGGSAGGGGAVNGI